MARAMRVSNTGERTPTEIDRSVAPEKVCLAVWVMARVPAKGHRILLLMSRAKTSAARSPVGLGGRRT